MYVYGDEYIAEDLTLENTAGRVGQALSLYAAPARGGFHDVRLVGHQDTLYTHEGSVLHFTACTIEDGVSSPGGELGFVTAASTVQGQHLRFGPGSACRRAPALCLATPREPPAP